MAGGDASQETAHAVGVWYDSQRTGGLWRQCPSPAHSSLWTCHTAALDEEFCELQQGHHPSHVCPAEWQCHLPPDDATRDGEQPGCHRPPGRQPHDTAERSGGAGQRATGATPTRPANAKPSLKQANQAIDVPEDKQQPSSPRDIAKWRTDPAGNAPLKQKPAADEAIGSPTMNQPAICNAA